ncbi:uncharacterized protein TM35_000212700 [Trypanosoma theileri]|uniref:Uncharacterized protein n=1 Tax=Trypanosoma theileri TaxID=67003 RepID=A0A1X0NSJ2_9TRYP|nr:uncharacterized protein TM35_000212700 [Trypanosoma theileri]ORC87664.1 hypothetical protein TM35_000212700 [Trypanosoma theileri]
MVSLASLEEVATKAETLRSFLRGAFLDDAPRLEVTIFNHLREVLNSWLEPLLSSSTSSEDSSQSQGSLRNLIEQYYLQELFAALLFLADESLLQSSPVSIAEIPKMKNSSVQDSSYYVDIRTKQYCGEMLLYLCFSRICRTHHVVQALYPLLLAQNEDNDGVSQNHISEGLFTSPRFMKKKKFISNLLNGVVIGLSDGVSAVVRVLLLDDRVKDDMTADAAKHIAHLFVTPLRSIWILEESLVVKYCENFPIMDQVRLFSTQLMNLTLFHAETPVIQENKDDLKQQMPLFLQKQQHLRDTSLLKLETLEERLHICVVTILNTIVYLYPLSEGKSRFDRSYKYFSLYNRYFLTPSFRALSLQSVTLGENDEVLLALRRFAALTNGSTLGPSPRGLLLTLDPISPGLLQLLEFGETIPTPHRDVLNRILDSLWKMEVQFEEIAYIFIRGAFVNVRGSFTIDRVGLTMSVDFNHVSSCASRLRGLQRLILCETTPTDFICKVLEAGARECQQRAASSLSVGIQKKEKVNTFLFTAEELESEDVNKDEDLILVRMIEEMCVGMNADTLFGTRVTLDRVCDVLSTVATISPVCWKWVMLLLPRILAVDIIHSIFSQYSTTAESCKPARALLMRLKRLESIITALCDDDSFVSASTTILRDAAIAVQQYDTVMSEEEVKEVKDATEAQCSKIARSIEESLNAKSISTLVVHLLALAQMAEENAWSISKPQTKTSNKNKNHKSQNKEKSNNSENSIQRVMWLLTRVLAEVDDACAAVNACKTMVWWSLARMESLDSSCIGQLVINLLDIDENNPLSFRSVIPAETAVATTAAALLPPQISRLKVRLLDVLLGLCDYDAEGRTLRNIDDYCKKTRKCGLYDILTGLCKPPFSDVVQVATMHFLGHYVVSTYPRVSLSSICTLCVDVFRHTPYEMAKAACASMLWNVVTSLESMGVIATLSDGEVTLLQNLAEAFRSYRCAALSEGIHEEVIHRHGDWIREVLQRESLVVREI